MQMFTYHYVRRAVNVRTAAVLAVSLVLGARTGVVRDSFRVGEDDFKTVLADADQILSIPTLKYGVTPLDLLVEAGPLKLAYGSTLLSLFTNAVPRNWWPDKPDTGGVFFTKEYTGDEWEGASNLTPTILGEAVINFGWLVGIPVFLIAYPALLYFVVRSYRRTQLRLRHAPGAVASIDFVITSAMDVGGGGIDDWRGHERDSDHSPDWLGTCVLCPVSDQAAHHRSPCKTRKWVRRPHDSCRVTAVCTCASAPPLHRQCEP
jgi:hypothetical protein